MKHRQATNPAIVRDGNRNIIPTSLKFGANHMSAVRPIVFLAECPVSETINDSLVFDWQDTRNPTQCNSL